VKIIDLRSEPRRARPLFHISGIRAAPVMR
jgi:hypothetical protein